MTLWVRPYDFKNPWNVKITIAMMLNYFGNFISTLSLLIKNESNTYANLLQLW